MANLIPGNPGTIRGALIGLRINGNYISCETSCDFNCDVEMLPATRPDAGRWKGFIPGIRSWTMSVNMNLLLKTVAADVKTVLSAILTGEEIQLEFRTRAFISPFLIISGSGFPQTAGISAPATGKTTSTVTFQGNGPFKVSSEEFYLIINAMPAEADKPVYIDTTQW